MELPLLIKYLSLEIVRAVVFSGVILPLSKLSSLPLNPFKFDLVQAYLKRRSV